MIPLHQLPFSRWRKIMRTKPITDNSWQNWQASERLRNRRIECAWRIVCSCVLLVIAFLIVGGCK